MSLSSIIILAFLLLVNGILIYSECCKRRDYATQLEQLKKEKIEKGFRAEELNEEDLKDEIEPKQRYSWIFGIVICLDIWIVGAICTHFWAAHFFIDVPDSDSRKALFGDSFGAVNALVSAFAFAGMIVAFILQRYELRLQRKELRDNRAEMEQQTIQFKSQSNNLEIQRFENLYYNMLNLQQKIVDGLRYDYYDIEYITVPLDGGGAQTDKKQVKREVVGRDVFRYLFNEVPMSISVDVADKEVNGYRWFLRYKGLDNYDATLIPSYFDHYFRHLYKIVQFVDSQMNLSFEEKYRYLSFMRGTLSRYELVWLYYNALYPDFYKFKALIEKYSLLKAVRSDLLTITKEALVFYDQHAISRELIKAAGYGLDDFAYYLTDNPEEPSKYMVSAFWNAEDHRSGLDYLSNWRDFVKKASSNV